MLSSLHRSVASLMAPIAQGLLELGIPGGAEIVKTVRQHFSSSNVLQNALDQSYDKAVHTIEVALAGPKFYEKASVKNFAEQFRRDILWPCVHANQANEAQFVQRCLEDLAQLRRCDFFTIGKIPVEQIAYEVGQYATSEKSQVLILQQQATLEFSNAVRSATTSPHMFARLIDFQNVILAAAHMHFSQEIQQDETLFRAFYIVNQKAMNRQLEQISQQLQTQQTTALVRQQSILLELRKTIDGGLQRANREIAEMFDLHQQNYEHQFGLIQQNFDTLVMIGRQTIHELQNLSTKIDESKNEIIDEIHKLRQELREIRGSQSSTTADEPGIIQKFLQHLQSEPLQQWNSAELLQQLGTLLDSSGHTQEAGQVFKRAQQLHAKPTITTPNSLWINKKNENPAPVTQTPPAQKSPTLPVISPRKSTSQTIPENFSGPVISTKKQRRPTTKTITKTAGPVIYPNKKQPTPTSTPPEKSPPGPVITRVKKKSPDDTA